MIQKANKVFCPNCGNEMGRINLNPGDAAVGKVLPGMYIAQRYMCYACMREKKVIYKKRGILLKKRILKK